MPCFLNLGMPTWGVVLIHILPQYYIYLYSFKCAVTCKLFIALYQLKLYIQSSDQYSCKNVNKISFLFSPFLLIFFLTYNIKNSVMKHNHSSSHKSNSWPRIHHNQYCAVSLTRSSVRNNIPWPDDEVLFWPG